MTRTNKSSDPLLLTSRVIITVAKVALIFTIVLLSLSMAAILTFGRADLLTDLAVSGAPEKALWLGTLAFAISIGLIMLAYKFLEELGQIILSVDHGDPFNPENAARLQRMGWITVIGHLSFVPIVGLAKWADPLFVAAGKTNHFVPDNLLLDGPDYGMILLTLILFILARVFKRGAEMREELEGTV